MPQTSLPLDKALQRLSKLCMHDHHKLQDCAEVARLCRGGLGSSQENREGEWSSISSSGDWMAMDRLTLPHRVRRYPSPYQR